MRLQTVLLMLGVIPGYAAELGSSLPWSFIPNAGQTDSSIKFVAETPDLRAGFGSESVTFRVRDQEIRLNFPQSDQNVKIDGSGIMPGRANFLTGQDRQHWQTGLPTYQQIVYHGLYPGIDMTYSGVGSRIKSEFVVAPSADPAQIRLDYGRTTKIFVDSDGSLVVKNQPMELREEAPVVYQESGGERVSVEGHFRLLGPHTIGFELGPYDRTKPLVIDPVVSYCTYLGGTGIGSVTGVAVDAVGNLYVAGWTEAFDFPMVGAVQSSNKGSVDAFVLKLNPAGTSILYSTYIGGRGDDRAAAIAVDSSGQAYVTGYTTSTNFPVVSPVRSTLGGTRNAFALKLNPAGSALVYSTYLGGSNYDMSNAIAVDAAGNAYIAGDTYSTDFPLSHPVQSSLGGQADAFVTRLTAAGVISFSSFLGGSNLEHAGGIAVDSSGNVYVAGGTASTNFPTSSAIQATLGGGQNGFVTKINTSAFTVVYSTYLGGNGGSPSTPEQANAITVDSSGNAYVAGVTNSTNFPVTSAAFQPAYDGAQDAFLAKINAAGNALVYSTYLGGSSFDWANGIAVDSNGNAYVAGYTLSADFPTDGGVQDALAGMYDAFITKMNPTGSALVYSTYYGGTRSDTANALAIDAYGNIFLGGQTSSFDLPLQGAIQTANNGGSTGWVMRLGFVTPPPPPPQAVSVTPATGSGSSQTFSFVFSDPNGAADLTSLQALFSTTSSNVNSCNISVDPVHGTISLANNAGTVFSAPLNLGASGTLSNNQCTVNGIGSGVISSGNTVTLTLAVSFFAAFNGAQNIYGYGQTAEALNTGWVQLGTYTAFVSSPAQTPQAVSATPSAGAGSGQTFSFVFTDGSGAADISGIFVGFGTSIWSASSCFLQLDATHTVVSLTNDATTVWMTAITLGSSATTQNSQCTLSGALSSVSSSGGTLTLNLGLTFQPSFEGARTIYAYAASAEGLNSGWQVLGTYTVSTASGPVASPALTPASGIYTLAQSVTITSGTAGASIRYTTNGSTPTETVGTLYSSPFSVNSTETVEAIAYKTGMADSAVVNGLYTISPLVAAPSFTPGAGIYSSMQNVTLSSATAGASIRYTTNGSQPTETAGTLYSAPFSVSSSKTITAIAYETGMTDSAVVSGAYTINIPTPTNSAQFVKTDLTTQGSWSGVYGSSGYSVIGANAVYPSGVTVTPENQSYYLWASSTTDVRAPQAVPSSTTRVAATWYSSTSFTIGLAYSDTAQHQIAIYNLDWDQLSRTQTISILDGTSNAVLDSRSIASFSAGQYLVWKVSGRVIVKVTNTGPVNAVISGIFLDSVGTNSPAVASPVFTPGAGAYSSAQSVSLSTATSGAAIRYTTNGSTPTETVGTLYNAPFTVTSSETITAIAYETGMTDSATVGAAYTINTGTSANSAQFVKTDLTTQGSWTGVYGSSGYNVIGANAIYPSDVTVTPANETYYLWSSSTTDVRAPQAGPSSTTRVAATWDSGTSFTIGLTYSDTTQHQIAIYSLDWDQLSRTQTISILDGTSNAVLDSRSLTNFSAGQYLVWKVSGSVIVKVTNTGPINAVISGLFLDPGTTNSTAVASPAFTPAAGTYSSAQSVGITTATAGASIRYTTNGSTPTETVGTLYGAPFTVSSSETIEAIAYQAGMTDSAVASTAYTINSGAPANSAQFVKTDLTTQGSWSGVYGSSGYNVIGTNAVYPIDATVTPNNETYYLWAGSTTDIRALQSGPSSTTRIAGTWDTYTSFTINVAYSDTAQHQIAIYCLDWDRLSRSQTLSILDGTSNAVLDSRSVTNFGNGEYLVWKVSGHVIVQVTNSGPNAVISGLFLD